MEVRKVALGTYRVYSEYDGKSIAVTAQEATLLFDYLLQHIGTIQNEAIEQKQRKLQPQAQTGKGRNR